MRQILSCVWCGILAIALSNTAQQGTLQVNESEEVDDLLRHVDVFIGVLRGNTYPGATVPFGMVQLSPMCGLLAGAAATGYDKVPGKGGTRLLGFALTAFSGVGPSVGGDFMLLPGVRDSTAESSLQAYFHEQTEKASPGYYSATVDIPNPFSTQAEVRLTAQKRSGMLHIKYKTRYNNVQPTLLLNLNSPLDQVKSCDARWTSSHALVASRFAGNSRFWNINHTAHTAIETSSPILSVRRTARSCTWQLDFNESVRELAVRVGLSYVDTAGAQGNLHAELGPSSNFDEVWSRARKDWQGALGRAKVSANEDILKRYYTALYHTMLGPTLFSDYDRRFRLGGPGEIMAGSFDFYSTFSLWDTYRAEHPLLNLLFPELATHFAQSLLHMKKIHGHLPRWVLYGLDTHLMIGYPAVNVISEIALKGLLQDHSGSKEASMQHLELDAFHELLESSTPLEQGISIDSLTPIPARVFEGMSKALEYAWSDSCLSKFAGKLGDKNAQQHYLQRSRLYQSYFHKESKMLLPRDVNGSIELEGSTVDKQSVKYYREGTPLQYTFMVPHDVPGLVELFGGEAALEMRLDDYFTGKLKDRTKSRDLATGRLGGHVQGNEPGHHIPYLYNFVGAPWKTQSTVDRLMALYKADWEGLPGDDDVGQMSAWFVFSALGFYPVDPCSGTYAMGRPLVEEATLQLERGTVHLMAYNQSVNNTFVSAASWNGAPLQGTTLLHEELVNGGELLFQLSDSSADFRGKTPRRGEDDTVRTVKLHRSEDLATKQPLMRRMQ